MYFRQMQFNKDLILHPVISGCKEKDVRSVETVWNVYLCLHCCLWLEQIISETQRIGPSAAFPGCPGCLRCEAFLAGSYTHLWKEEKQSTGLSVYAWRGIPLDSRYEASDLSCELTQTKNWVQKSDWEFLSAWVSGSDVGSDRAS